MSYASYILDRINELCEKTGTSRYQLAKNSGIPESSLSNLFNKKHTPRLETLDKICDAFGITLAQFFSDSELFPNVTEDVRQFTELWQELNTEERRLTITYLRGLKRK